MTATLIRTGVFVIAPMKSLSLSDGKSLCPRCNRYAQLLTISKASRIADVSRRTIYNYIEEGSVYALKLAGKTQRVCSGCLFVDSESCASELSRLSRLSKERA